MLAKVIAPGPTRDDALGLLREALAASRVDGIVTNLGLVRSLTDDTALRAAVHSTTSLAETSDPDPRIDVIAPGPLTTVQDLPGPPRLLACRRAAERAVRLGVVQPRPTWRSATRRVRARA